MDGKRVSLIGPDHNDYAVEYSINKMTYPKIGGLFVFNEAPSQDTIDHVVGVVNGWNARNKYLVELYECEIGDEVQCINKSQGLNINRGKTSKQLITDKIRDIWTKPTEYVYSEYATRFSKLIDNKKTVSWVMLTKLISTHNPKKKYE